MIEFLHPTIPHTCPPLFGSEERQEDQGRWVLSPTVAGQPPHPSKPTAVRFNCTDMQWLLCVAQLGALPPFQTLYL